MWVYVAAAQSQGVVLKLASEVRNQKRLNSFIRPLLLMLLCNSTFPFPNRCSVAYFTMFCSLYAYAGGYEMLIILFPLLPLPLTY